MTGGSGPGLARATAAPGSRPRAPTGASGPEPGSLTGLEPRPGHPAWRYDRAELRADAAVHAIGLALAVVGIIALISLGSALPPADFAALLIYSTGLMGVLGISAAYNTLPVSPLKWRLRRFDHAAIYVLIAGTYTPLVLQLKNGAVAAILLAGVWTASIVGLVLKLALPGRFDRLSVALYLAIAWSGIAAHEAVTESLPVSTLRLIAAGGILYTTGVVFHLWEGLRFQNAIWHAFVLLAAACHYAAVLDCLILAPASGA